MLFIKAGVHFAFGIWKGLTEKADFDFVEFCNVMEWTLEHNKGKEQLQMI